MAPSSACSASKLCGGSRRRMSSAPGRRVTLDESFSGSMESFLLNRGGHSPPHFGGASRISSQPGEKYPEWRGQVLCSHDLLSVRNVRNERHSSTPLRPGANADLHPASH